MEYSFQRYLSAKRTIDDRALNRMVWSQMTDITAGIQNKRELKVLEVGAGIGTMLQRMLEWGALTRASYLATDVLAENIELARKSFPIWARRAGYQVSAINPGSFYLKKNGQDIEVGFEAVDVVDFLLREESRSAYDLIVAHAFLDLFDLHWIIPKLSQLVCNFGLMLFTINFDGDTIFEPVWDGNLEQEILGAYHLSMDQRVTDGRPSGDSRAGRHLFTVLGENNLEILASGSSDWVVFPQGGQYPADEAYFLYHMLSF